MSPIPADLSAQSLDLGSYVLAAVDPETRETAIIEPIDCRQYHAAGHFLTEMYGRGYDILVLPSQVAKASQIRHAQAIALEDEEVEP